MKIKKNILTLVLIILSNIVYSQTVVLQPDGVMGKDALIAISDNGLISGSSNFGTAVEFKASRYNAFGNWFKSRSLLQYDLSFIPKNAIITSATLTLGGVSHNTSGQSNASTLLRVTGYWDEQTVTWNNQPSTTPSGQIALAASTTVSQDYVLDVKANVQDMVTNPSCNFGWMLKLNGEGTAAAADLYFASSDYTVTQSKRPKLEITYTLLEFKQVAATTSGSSDGSIDLTVSGTSAPYTYSWKNSAGTVISTSQDPTSLLPGAYSVAVTDANSRVVYGYAIVGSKNNSCTVSFQPDGNYGKDAAILKKLTSDNVSDLNNATYANLNTYSWTISGVWTKYRNLIAFDFSSIPKYAIVTDAKLYLYGIDHATTQQSNASVLQRVTNPWSENFVTWNTQPTSISTGEITVPITTTSTEDKVVNITNHVQDMVRSPETNYGWLFKMIGEANALQARMTFGSSDNATSSKRPKLELTFYIPDMEDQRNWVDVETFDNNGNTSGKKRTYIDALGRTMQEQALDIANGNVLAAKMVYDDFGRGILQTLPAPLYRGAIYYKDAFITTESENYDYYHFNTLTNEPSPVDYSTQGSLGWYYSNNNYTEPYVPTSSFPFSSVEYYNDPLGRVKRVAGIGEQHRMNSGHETKSYYMSTAGELFYAYGYKSSYILGFNQSDPEYKACDNLSGYKTIQVDADGKESVTFMNGGGQVIATCMSGMGTTCASQKVKQMMYYKGERGVTVHLPGSKKNTLKLIVPGVATARFVDPIEGTNTTDHKQLIDYYITDLITGKLMVAGTDYTIDRNTRAVSFLGSYATGSGYFRISFDYRQIYLDERYNPNYPCTCQKLLGYHLIPDLMVEYELDYSDWNLNYYDKAGNLVKTVSNQAIDCTYDPVTNYTVEDGNITKQIAVSSSCSTPLHTITTTPVSNYDKAMSLRVEIFGGYTGCSGNGTYTYPKTNVSDGSSTSTPAFMSNDEVVPNNYIQAYTVDTTNQFRYYITDASRPPNGDIQYKYEMYLTLCSNTGGIIGTGNYLFLDGINYAVDFNVPSSTMANCSQVKVKLESITVYKYVYNTNTQQYVFDGTSNYSPGVNSIWDNTLCHYRLGVKWRIQKYPTPSTNINSNLSSTTSYNKLGKPFKSSSIDEGTVNVVYDTEGKVRFTQNALQAATGKFSYIAYDRAGRVIEMGEYNPNISASGSALVFQAYNSDGSSPSSPATNNVHHATVKDAVGWAYANRSTQQTYYFYDVSQSDFPSGYSTYKQTYKDGMLSKTENSIGKTWYGYDDLGRMIWAINGITGLGNKTVQYNYTADGLLDNYDYQAGTSTERFIHKYVYDANYRLIETKTSLDNSTFTTNQKLEYYLHGALKRNELGGTIQGLDYVYTINGQLKSVNEPTLSSRDPGKDSYPGAHSSFKQDVFGYTLDYYANDYIRQNTLIETYTPGGSNTALPDLYSGQVKSTRWKTTLPSGAIASSTFTSGILQYSYKYDNKNQLVEAIFGTITAGTLNGSTSGTGPTFAEEANAYRVNNITYDKIGNLKTLKRQAKPTLLSMDDFTYVYDTNIPNRLTSITDGGTSTNYGDDIDSQGSNNYQYNSIGQLTKDVSGNYDYIYDVYGKVTAVKKSSTGYNIITIEYNAQGQRQKKVNYDASGVAINYTWYVYDGGGALLSTYYTEVSTSTTTQKDLQVYGAGRIGVYNRTASFDVINYVYELTDHLGNVRSTVRNNAGNAEVLSFTDYYPHGSAMPGRNYVGATAYRYAYQGQEKDTETGFINFELRQYDARVGRWFNPDPMGQYHSPYLAMGNNPVSIIDPTGGYDTAPSGWGSLSGNSTPGANVPWTMNVSDEWRSEHGQQINGLNWEAAGFNNAVDAYFAGKRNAGMFNSELERMESNLSLFESWAAKTEGYRSIGGGHYLEIKNMPRIDGRNPNMIYAPYPGFVTGGQSGYRNVLGANINIYGARERTREWLMGFNDYYLTGESDDAKTAATNNFILGKYNLFFITNAGDRVGNMGANYFVNLNSATQFGGQNLQTIPVRQSLISIPQSPIPNTTNSFAALNLQFLAGQANFATAGDRAVLARIARNIINDKTGASTIILSFRRDIGPNPTLLNQRATLISQTLQSFGVPSTSIWYAPGGNQYNFLFPARSGLTNQTLFNIITTRIQ